MTAPGACESCLKRTWLIAALAGRLEHRLRGRRAIPSVLALPDDDLLAALAGADQARLASAYASFDPADQRAKIAAVGLRAICRHDDAYPASLESLPDAPAALHVAGDVGRLAPAHAVAVVGARRASDYGLEVARAIGRGLGAAGVTVVSGLALGVDSAAHAGALEARGPTVAVLGGGADRPYPAAKEGLHREIAKVGAVVSELPPGFRAFRWCFPARNRIIAGLAAVTVVVEATEASGSLITAGFARDLGREVGAVPGRVTAPSAAGTNALLYDGAHVVRGAEDVLDLFLELPSRAPPPRPAPPPLPAGLGELLAAVADGRDTVGALTAGGVALAEAMTGLTQLELLGRVRREAGGRYVALA